MHQGKGCLRHKQDDAAEACLCILTSQRYSVFMQATDSAPATRVNLTWDVSLKHLAAKSYCTCLHLHKTFVLLQAAAFDGWLEAVQTFRHKRQVAQQAARRIANIRLSQAFTRWQEQAEALQLARAQAGHIAAHMRNQALAAAFNGWADAVQHRQTQSIRQQQLADVAVVKARAALVAHCFEVSNNQIRTACPLP